MKPVSLCGIAYALFQIGMEEFNGYSLPGILLRSNKLRRMCPPCGSTFFNPTVAQRLTLPQSGHIFRNRSE